MADSKITALTALTAADPANDMMPIVDVSDTSMAASGTTKRISINNILACSPTATLASATITGDLTVDTNVLKVDTSNNRVGVLTATPRVSLDVASGDIYSAGQVTWGGSSPTANQGFLSYTGGNAVVGSTGATSLLFYTNGAERYSIGSTGISTWSVGGSTAMTLNSTGLGVGDTPASNTRLTIAAASRLADTTGQAYIRSTDAQAADIGAQLTLGGLYNASSHYAFGGIAGRKENGTSGNVAGYLDFLTTTSGGSLTSRMRIDSTGNVGVGVTPSAWSGYLAIQNKSVSFASAANTVGFISGNAFYDGAWKYINTGAACQYAINNAGLHAWSVAPSGTAGNAITFTQAMTLDASGRLLVGATAITAGYTGNNYFVVGGVTSPTIKLQSTTGPAAWDIYSAGGLDLFLGYNAVDKGQFSRTTGAYTALSDANKKKDFEPSNIGLAEVLKLKPTLFRMIDAADGSAKELGFIAQDVQSVIPQAYVESESQGGKFIGLQDRPIIAALTRAIQELTARVQTLEAR